MGHTSASFPSGIKKLAGKLAAGRRGGEEGGGVEKGKVGKEEESPDRSKPQFRSKGIEGEANRLSEA